MHVRYLQSLALGIFGGFVVAASQAFTSGVTAWLAFALGITALVLAFTPVLVGERRWVLSADVITGVLAIWTIVASVTFAGSAVLWLSFAEAIGFVALAIAGLTVDHLRLAHRARLSAKAPTSEVANEQRPTSLAA